MSRKLDAAIAEMLYGVSGVVGSLSKHQLLTALHLCANVLKDALHKCDE